MRQRTKFAIGLLTLTLVLLAAVFGVTEWFQRQAIDRTEQEVNQTVSVTADQISTLIEARRDYVGYVASRPEASNFNRTESFLAEFLGNSRFFAAYVTDANGTVVDFQGGISAEVRNQTIGEDHSGRPYVAAALNGSTYITDPEYAEATDQYLVLMSAPIVTPGGEVAGTLVGSIYLARDTFFLPVVPLETAFQTVTVWSGNETIYAGNQTFERSVSSTAVVEGTDWRVRVSRDRSRLEGRLRQLLIAQQVGVLVVVLAMISFGAWDYRSNLRQTQRLLDGFDAIQRGQYDYDLSMEAGEEWIQISDGFNDLADGLAQREAEIRERERRLDVLNRILRHNLRNEMSVVINYADVIASQAADETMQSAGETISRVGEELAELSQKARRLEAAMQEKDRRARTDIAVVVGDTLDDCQSEYPDVTVSRSLPEEAVVVGIPSVDLALRNVVENAFKHNESRDPHVGVSVRRDGDHWAVVVGDNGPGLPDQEWKTLKAGEETDLEHGSGIGLWNAYLVVEQSGGDIEFLRTASTGTVIKMTFEAADDSDG